jgi:hypothetical protein
VARHVDNIDIGRDLDSRLAGNGRRSDTDVVKIVNERRGQAQGFRGDGG